MNKIFLIIFYAIFAHSVSGQIITGNVVDEITWKPISGVEVCFSDNELENSKTIITDAGGNFAIDVSTMKNTYNVFNVKISKKNYNTTFASINSKITTSYFFKISKIIICSYDTVFATYKTGQIELDCTDNDKLFELANAIKDKTDFIIVINFYYSPDEFHGFATSIQRANYISAILSKYGAISENYNIRVFKGENSFVKLSGVKKMD